MSLLIKAATRQTTIKPINESKLQNHLMHRGFSGQRLEIVMSLCRQFYATGAREVLQQIVQCPGAKRERELMGIFDDARPDERAGEERE